MAGCESVG